MRRYVAQIRPFNDTRIATATPFAVTLAAFLALSAAALTTFPPYYEDESWNYLAVFELLRGNGLTWAAFGDGRPLLGVFGALVAPFVAVSPLAPEPTIRAISIMAAVFVLTGAYVIGRSVASPLAWLPPAAIFSTPYLFTALRYGRNDVVGLAFALWSVAAGAWNWPFAAGVLSGLAASVHPLFTWLAVPGLVLSARSGARGVARWVIGGCVGVLPQAAWVFYNWDDVRDIVVRYAVSSSVGGHGSGGLLRSLADEPSRYAEYVRAMSGWNMVSQGFLYVALPLVGVWYAVRQRSGLILSLGLAPILGTALLVQTKNPYYVYDVLAFLAVVGAFGASTLAPRLRAAVALCVLAAAVASTVRYSRQIPASRDMLTAAATTSTLAASLPKGAVVIAPNLYAGMIVARPDLHFFNYHALSLRPGWGLPACSALPARIRALIASDPRTRPAPLDEAHEAYFIAQSEPVLLAYLQQIYVRSSADDVRCMLAPEGGTTTRVPVCAASGAPCVEFQLARMPLHRE